jgi:hypothetical protein
VSALTIIFLLLTGWAGSGKNIYTAGAMLFALPALFVLGLLMIPLGVWIDHKRRPDAKRYATLGEAVAAVFQTRHGRRKVGVILGLTVVNVLIIALVGHNAKAYMDSPGFCGTACHSVMEPEYDTYVASPHARVACVDCHIGPGASFAVKSKIDGLRQVWKTWWNTYQRPVPTPVHTLRPSRDTCEHCHWPDKFHGKKIVSDTHIDTDKDNSLTVSVLVLNVGGYDEATGKYEGIHWHVSRDHEVRYEALDEKREVIGKITVYEKGKVIKVYDRVTKEGEKALPVVETRIMDCIDCHNRPTHIFDQTPADALDRAFGDGRLDRSVPYLCEVAEPLLARGDLSRADAHTRFRADLEAAYREKHPDSMPDAAALDKAGSALADIWLYNIYPDRGVTWGTYPTNIGHQSETPERHGCWRCHGPTHKDAEGHSLSQSCTLCHEPLAMDDDPEDLDDSTKVLISAPR